MMIDSLIIGIIFNTLSFLFVFFPCLSLHPLSELGKQAFLSHGRSWTRVNYEGMLYTKRPPGVFADLRGSTK